MCWWLSMESMCSCSHGRPLWLEGQLPLCQFITACVVRLCSSVLCEVHALRSHCMSSASKE
jgi:hypothetical protein